MPWPALAPSGLQRFESATTFPAGSHLRGEHGSRRLVARGEIGVEELEDGLQFGSFGGGLHALNLSRCPQGSDGHELVCVWHCALGLLAAQLTDLDSFAVTGPTARSRHGTWLFPRSNH